METVHPLKNYRDNQKPPLSQGDLAVLVGVVRETVARWETGKRKPDEELLPKITEVTGIAASKLRPDLIARSALFSEAAAE